MEEQSMEQMVEEALDLIAEIASNWQDDTPTDEVARAIVGSSNPIFHIMEKMVKDPEGYTPNLHVMMVLVKLSYAQVMAIKELEELADLRKKG